MTVDHARVQLTHGQLAKLRRVLLEQQRSLRREAALPPQVTDAPSRDADPSDEASDSLAQDEALAGSEHARARLAEVDAALARIAAGTYGLSELSGAPIGYARLVAVPWARLTVQEQEDLDRVARG